MLKISERRLEELPAYFDNREGLWRFYGRTVFITKKGKVVAHARWDLDRRLVISKIRRPSSTGLEVGQVIYWGDVDRYAPIPVPRELPRLQTEGLLCFRTGVYSSEAAIRRDPFWEHYEGWMLIPREINGASGLDVFFREYPELTDAPYSTIDVDQVDSSTWKMARQYEVDAYVCGETDRLPTLVQFCVPKQNDVVTFQPVIGPTGNFEYFSLYWMNAWIVYVPRLR